MPSNRKRIRRGYTPSIRKDYANYLLYGIEVSNNFDFYLFKNNRDRQNKIWQETLDKFMAYWLKSHPCTRPFAWWEFEAPEQRKMVGGKGTTADQKFNYRQSFKFGIPQYWLEIDRKSPPHFESQTAFLKRLYSLNDGEEKLLSENPELLQSEDIFNILSPRMVFDVSKCK